MKRRKNLLLQRVEYSAYPFVSFLIRRASEESMAKWGTRLGNLGRKVLRGRDRLAMRNITAAFPEMSQAQRRQTIDECWRHFGREMLAFVNRLAALGLRHLRKRGGDVAHRQP